MRNFLDIIPNFRHVFQDSSIGISSLQIITLSSIVLEPVSNAFNCQNVSINDLLAVISFGLQFFPMILFMLPRTYKVLYPHTVTSAPVSGVQLKNLFVCPLILHLIFNVDVSFRFALFESETRKVLAVFSGFCFSCSFEHFAFLEILAQ